MCAVRETRQPRQGQAGRPSLPDFGRAQRRGRLEEDTLVRVVGGTAGGVPLAVPRGDAVRPTMDQVRGAIFSSLAERAPGARVLDLFAGAGGLGIEALSRGASRACLVERDRRAVECIRRNLEKTRLAPAAEVVCLDVFTFLDRRAARPDGGAFDLIFADPPYTTVEQTVDYATRLLESASLRAALAPEGVFVLEKSPRHAPAATALAAWAILLQKRYGTTEVLFLQPAAAATAATAAGAAGPNPSPEA